MRWHLECRLRKSEIAGDRGHFPGVLLIEREVIQMNSLQYLQGVSAAKGRPETTAKEGQLCHDTIVCIEVQGGE